jgi:hypothetical protein
LGGMGLGSAVLGVWLDNRIKAKRAGRTIFFINLSGQTVQEKRISFD